MEELTQNGRQGGLTGNLLKWLAIACMLIDHIAWAFVPTGSPLGIILHFIGRVTGPTMFFFIAEGYYHTRDVKRYALRLLVFAAISWPCFSFFETGTITLLLGVIWTLLLGLLALWACDKLQNPVLRVAAVLFCCLLSILGDWPVYGVLYILAFGLNRGSFKRQAFWYSLVTLILLLPNLLQLFFGGRLDSLPYILINLGVFLPLLPLYFYNGRRGGKPWMKWAFYVFYPAHLLILGLLKLIIS